MQKIIKFLSRRINTKETIIISILITSYLSLLYYFSSFKFHYQEDEFITAYISFFLPPLNKIDWFSVVPNKQDWLTQFPVFYFFIQKIFFKVLGPSLETIRISTWPYHIITVLYLYLIGKIYFVKKGLQQFLPPLMYIGLAPNLYLSSLGLHFISSVAFFTASFYYFLLIIKRGRILYTILCGVFMGLSYLTYSSSYIVLPLLTCFILFESVIKRTLKYIKLFGVSLIISLLIIFPFIVYAITEDNFFIQRVNQVNLSNSTETQQQLKSGISFFLVITNATQINFKSLFIKDIGGINEYYFGHQALFNPLTFILLIIGAICCILIFLKKVKQNTIHLYPPFIFLTAFSLGMVLTVPTGAFHRIYISFPFIALIIAIGIDLVLKKIKYHLVFTLGLILLFGTSNLISVQKMIKEDQNISILTDSVYLESVIKENAKKESRVFVSAYPAYHIGKELVFRTENLYKIKTDYFPTIFPLLRNSDFLVLHYPEKSQVEQLYNKFPNGILISKIGEYNLKYHNIFLTNYGNSRNF